MAAKIRNDYPDILYKSIDINYHLPHYYHSLDEIDGHFDLILLLDVIELLELEDGVRMLERINELLIEGGNLIINTPNIFCPSRPLFNTTRKMAYSYEEVGGIVLSRGFDILGIYRICSDSSLKCFLSVIFFYLLYRILNVDFAQSILINACKKG
jgi:hypothetical protein